MIGRIYNIMFPDGYYYLGSTFSKLEKRLYHHKCKYNRETSNEKLYVKWREYGRNAPTITLMEEYTCENRRQLEERENEYILLGLEDDLCLNVKRSIADPLYNHNYHLHHKDTINARKKEYKARPENKERANLLRRQRRLLNKNKNL